MNLGEVERRQTLSPVEARSAGVIFGYAAKFGRRSKDLGGFVEVVAPSAFIGSRAAGWPDVMARYNHDDGRLLGTMRAGTLRLGTDGTGLHYEVDLPESRGDVYELVQRGDVARSSFAFRVNGQGDEWSLTGQGFPQRILYSLQLVDVAPVNTSGHVDTSVACRSLARRVGADPAEVRRMAARGELRRFFTRTDRPTRPTLTGDQARRSIIERRKGP